MLISTTSVSTIAQEFVQQQIIPKAPNSISQFGIGFFIPYIPTLIEQKLKNYIPMLKLSGIIDENSNIDIDKAKMSALKSLELVGNKLNIFGYILDKDDVEKLYLIAEKHQISPGIENSNLNT